MKYVPLGVDLASLDDVADVVIWSDCKEADVIPDMDWGDSFGEQSLLETWWIKLSSHDRQAFSDYKGDIHVFLLNQILQLLNFRGKVGQYGQQFSSAGFAQVVACYAWGSCDCKDDMKSTFCRPGHGEEWWPCLTAFTPNGPREEVLPFYSPEHAWNDHYGLTPYGSNPLGCHITRLHRREEVPLLRRRLWGTRPQAPLGHADVEPLVCL